MRLGIRLLFAFFLINGIAAFFVLRVFTAEIKPSVREVMEDMMVDTAYLLAELASDVQVLSQSDVIKGYGQDFGDLSRFITTTGNVNNINAQNVATADQYARAQALNNIYANPSNLLTDPSQAGTYNTDLIDFNSADALQQLTNQIGTAEQQRIAQQNQINASGGQQQAGGGLSGVIAGAAIGGSVGGPVGAVIGGVIGAIFCHVKGTMVKMEDGSYKAIEDI